MTEYITREAALMAVCRADLPDKTEDGTPILNGKRKVSDCVRRIKAIPAADVEEKRTGKWIKTSYVERSAFGRAIWHKTFQCSRCGSLFGREGDKYCYNCGADMRGEDDVCLRWMTGRRRATTVFEDLAFKPPVHAIRVKACGNDWVTDCDATLTADKIRGFALDSEGVKVYSRERDIHGDYDNIYVPYSNLEALVFYFSEPPKEET